MRLPVFVAIALATPAALAQVPAPAAPAGDVGAAAAAFQQGQRAQLAQDFSRAADFFELADQAAPSAAALRSAIRSHQAAGHAARAATLALVAEARDAADAQSAQLAHAVLAELGPRLARVHLTCTPDCAVSVDQHAVRDGIAGALAFFVDAGTHTLASRWPGRGERTRTLEAVAGQSVELALEAPPPVVVAPTPAPVIVVAPPVTRPMTDPHVDAHPRRPLSPVVFWVGLGATVATGAVLVWSGLDTLSARDTYVATPTETLYRSGVSSELRTNVLVGTAAAVGAATVLIGALFTDWSGPRRDVALLPTAGAHDGRPTLGLAGTF